MIRREYRLGAGAVAVHVITVERDDGAPRTYYRVDVPPVGALVDTSTEAAAALRMAADALRCMAEQADALASVMELQRT